jgi:hypothetical protein
VNSSASGQAGDIPRLLSNLVHREYPVAPDRSGSPGDFDNYPRFLTNLRNSLDASGATYGLSITLPASYWYLQHFDVISLAQVVDWFNVMTYDLHVRSLRSCYDGAHLVSRMKPCFLNLANTF